MPGSPVDGCAVDGDAARLEHTAKIRDLNDLTREAMSFRFIYVTVGIRALGAEAAANALVAVRTFTSFDAGNDPYREHDFGSFTLTGQLMFWKIDYYDRKLEESSPDPTDEKLTSRVLTVMLASEY